MDPAGKAEVELRLRSKIAEELPGLNRRLKATSDTIAALGGGLSNAAAGGLTRFNAAAEAFHAAGDGLSTISVETGSANRGLDQLQSSAEAARTAITDTSAATQQLRDGQHIEQWAASSVNSVSRLRAGFSSLWQQLMQQLPAIQDLLKTTGELTAKVGAGLTGASAMSLGLFTASAKSFSSAGDELSKLSTRTGVSVSLLSELQYAAVRVGASMSDVEEVLSAMKSGKTAELWASKSAGVLRLLTADLRALRIEAKGMALDMSGQDSAAAVQLASAMATSAYLISALWREVGAAVAPAISQAALGMRQLIAPAIQLIRNNREIVRVIFVVMAVAAKLGAGLAALGAVIAGAGVALGFLSGAFAPLLVGFGVLAAGMVIAYRFRDAIAAVMQSIARQIAPVIDAVRSLYAVFADTLTGVLMALGSGQLETAATIAWLGFVAAAWTGIALFAQALDAGLGYLESWIPGIDSVMTYLRNAFGGVYDAILAGRWDLAGEIMMTKLQIAWHTGLFSLLDAWDTFSNALKSTFPKTVSWLTKLWHDAVDGIALTVAWIMEKTGLAAAGTMAELERMQQAEQRAREQRAQTPEQDQADLQNRMLQRRQMLDQLRQQLAALDAQASQSRADAGQPTLPDRANQARAELQKAIADFEKGRQTMLEKMPGAAGSMSKPLAVKNSETRGTFTAAAATIIGGSSNHERETASNTRLMARLMAKVADNTKPNGVTA